MKLSEGYYIGLDIGTSSVGWAVADKEYKIPKFKGHKMWGTRLFNEAETAEVRRTYRSTRRRSARKKERLSILRELFKDAISEVDPEFLLRLDESKFYPDEKKVNGKYSLFNDKDYTDSDFYKEYPTIYHLRKAISQGDKQSFDVREVYLALHHILKNRGHFLFKGDFSAENQEASIANQILELLNTPTLEFNTVDFDISAIERVLTDNNLGIQDKTNAIKQIAEIKERKDIQELLKLTYGGKAKLSIIFNREAEEYSKLSIKLSDIDYDEKRPEYEDVIGEDIYVLDDARLLYDQLVLLNIKYEGMTISQSKVKDFDKHKQDLELLKEYVQKNYPKQKYDEVFNVNDKEFKNYVAYTGHHQDHVEKCTQEDFYKFLNSKKGLDFNSRKDSIVEKIKKDIDKEYFLPLQKNKHNSVIPYQVHYQELDMILTKASEYLPFLNEVDEEYNIKTSDKIREIMKFKIPYYIGPLNDTHSKGKDGFSWIVRESGKIYPWNFDEKVDQAASHTAFIETMTNECSYLIGEKVLPKESLLYSKYRALNELNALQIDGERLDSKMKETLINEMKRTGKGLTKKQIVSVLHHQNLVSSDAILSGTDQGIKTKLTAYYDFKKILGNQFDYVMVEDLIKWITLFGQDIKSTLNELNKHYPDNDLTENQKTKIARLRYKDWGRFSRRFLTDIIDDNFISPNGEVGNIISAMENYSLTLMELLSDVYDYNRKIKEFSDNVLREKQLTGYELLDELQLSPAIKRGVWQSLRIVEELIEIIGFEPKKIFVEVTRTNRADKKRSSSRKERLLELYKSIRSEDRDWKSEIADYSDDQLRSKKRYLYYLQEGKDAYTGESISLNELFKTDSSGKFLYDIDHIYPQSKVKDNSFDNLVLTSRLSNDKKSDRYPIDLEVQHKCRKLWKYWRDRGFISDTKYQRLTRTNSFSPEEMNGFIARQMVETNQSVKAVTQLLNHIYPDSRIVYTKAENVSDFRHEKDFIKVRELNNHHHAKDSYLNIVVGNVYDEKFTKSPLNFLKNQKDKGKSYRDAYSLNNIFKYPLERHNYLVWNPVTSMKTVNKMMKSNDIRVTMKLEEKSGAFYKESITPKEKSKNSIYAPQKTSDERLLNVEKYGGYSSIATKYYVIVSYELLSKNKIENKINVIPIYILEKEWDVEQLRSKIKIRSNQEIKNMEILYKRLPQNSLIKFNGFLYRIGGKTGSKYYIDSAIEIVFDKEIERYIKKVTKYHTYILNDKNYLVRESAGNINTVNNLKLYKELVNKMNLSLFKKLTNKGNVLSEDNVISKFEESNLNNQLLVLIDMLNLLSNRSTTYPILKKVLGVTASRNTFGQNISNCEEFKIISQSVTGLYENITVIKGED